MHLRFTMDSADVHALKMSNKNSRLVYSCTAIQSKYVIRLSSFQDQYFPRERTHLASRVSNQEVEIAVALEVATVVVSVEVTEADSEEVLVADSVVETEADPVEATEVASVVVHQEAVSDCKRIN